MIDEDKDPSAVVLATEDGDLGLVSAEKAKDEAQAVANEEGKTVTIRHPESDKVLGKAKPVKAQAAAKPRPASKAEAAPKASVRADRKAAAHASRAGVAKRKATPAKRERAAKAAPTGMVARILKLASRTNGASRDELNTLTGWRGAPWKWLFSNPKGTGYCDRWKLKFAVKRDDGVRYHVAKS